VKYIKQAFRLLALFGWRSFGAFLVILGGGAAAGGFAGNVWLGVGITWLATTLAALAVVGTVIMLTGQVDEKDIATAWKSAGRELKEKIDSKK